MHVSFLANNKYYYNNTTTITSDTTVTTTIIITITIIWAERLAGSTAPSVRPRWAAPLVIQSPTARKGD